MRERLERLKELWGKGLKSEEIARELGISVDQVSSYAVAAGLIPQKLLKHGKFRKVTPQVLIYMRDMFLDGASIEEIADFIGINEKTVRQYLRSISLTRGRSRSKEKITREKLKELCEKGYSDRETAKYFGVSPEYIAFLRHKYGIYKKGPRGSERTRRLEEIADIIMQEIYEKNYTTSRELREKGVEVNWHTLRELEDFIEGLQWFRITQTSTSKCTIFPPKLAGLIVIYVEGAEEEVARFLLSQALSDSTRALIALLRNWGAPEKLRDILSRGRV